MKHWTKLVLATATMTLFLGGAGCGKDEPKAGADTAASLEQATTQATNLAELLKFHSSHLAEPTPWIGYWYPYSAGGIVSAAAKYDQAYSTWVSGHGMDTGRLQSSSSWEVSNHGPGYYKLESWFGHCNGWTASAIMVPEPRAPKVIEGIEFSISDQKAILAESWLEFSGDFVGTRVNDKGDMSSAAFWDVVPAQFVLMLTNVMGKQKRPIIIDRHTAHEIWNQPLAAYAFNPVRPADYLGPDPRFPNIHRVNMTGHIWWANDNVGGDEISPAFSLPSQEELLNRPAGDVGEYFYPSRTLQFEVWLDGPAEFDEGGNLVRSGNILVTQEDGRYVGGIWKNALTGSGSVNSHPDYMWVPFGRQGSSGYKNPLIDDGFVETQVARKWGS